MDGKGAGDPQGGADNAGVEIEVNGEKKVLTAEQVTNLLGQNASMEKKLESAAAALKAAEKYEVTVPEMLQSMEGSFATMTKLVDAGVIDKQGNLINKEPEKTDPDPKGDPNVDPKANVDLAGMTKKFDTVAKAMEDIVGRIDGIERDQGRLFKGKVQEKIMADHPELDNDDVAKVFAIARRDRSKDIWEVADLVAKDKGKKMEAFERATAKKLGVDYDAWKENQLKEQDPDHGSAVFLTKGKRLSFSNRKKPGEKDEDLVDPKQAAMSFLSGQNTL